MLSRVAESLYWMARFIERAENSARLINVNANLLLDLPRGISPGWEPLTVLTGSDDLFASRYEEYSERNVVRFLLGDLNNPSSVLVCLSQARENARTVRDILPREVWEQINDLYLFAKDELSKGLSKRNRYDYLKSIILHAQQITGLLAGTMNHDCGYDFVRIGRNLERADMTTRIVDVRSASLLPDQPELTPFENIQWMSVLHSLSAYQMYRRHMQVRVRRTDVLTFLLQNTQFPRAFLHCLDAVENCLHNLPRSDAPLRVVASDKRFVKEARVAALQQSALHEFIDELQLGLGNLHTQIANTYFLADLSTAAESQRSSA